MTQTKSQNRKDVKRVVQNLRVKTTVKPTSNGWLKFLRKASATRR
jgi:hypothetical protein